MKHKIIDILRSPKFGEFIRFAIVGVLATAIHYGLYLLLVRLFRLSEFRLSSRRATQELMRYPERNMFIRGMVKLLGFKTAEVYYDRKEYFAGESKYPLSKMLNFAVDGITSFSIQPLRLITTFGFIVTLLSIVAAIYALVSHLCGNTVVGWTSMLISIWFIGGAILLSLGVIGEYIGKIYREVKRRPRYHIEKTV